MNISPHLDFGWGPVSLLAGSLNPAESQDDFETLITEPGAVPVWTADGLNGFLRHELDERMIRLVFIPEFIPAPSGPAGHDDATASSKRALRLGDHTVKPFNLEMTR